MKKIPRQDVRRVVEEKLSANGIKPNGTSNKRACAIFGLAKHKSWPLTLREWVANGAPVDKVHHIPERPRRAKEKPAIKSVEPPQRSVTGDGFLQTYDWRRLRMQAITRYGARCQCCGASPDSGAIINVDHIKPRRLFPQLALDIENLQVLCHECNHGKGNWDMTDWRPTDDQIEPEQAQHLKDILAE